MACLIHDAGHGSGQGGFGAVFGSKNLKAVAVRGTLKVPVADRSRVTAISRWLGENYKDLMGWAAAGIGRGR